MSVTIISPAKTAEPIEMPFGMWIRGRGQMKHVVHVGAYWHQLSNTTELSVCGGDAAFYQITLTTCSLFLFFLEALSPTSINDVN